MVLSDMSNEIEGLSYRAPAASSGGPLNVCVGETRPSASGRVRQLGEA
jgi:hypothetical protein